MRNIVQHTTYNEAKNSQFSPFNRIKRSSFMGPYHAVETIKRHVEYKESTAQEGGEQDGHSDGAIPEGTRRNVHIVFHR